MLKRLQRVALLTLLIATVMMLNVFAVNTVSAAPPPPPNNCVGIASDSNGFGHVTFQLPPAPDGPVGIIYIRPFKVVLRQQLDALGLDYLAVRDHSVVANSLTASDRTNYLKSSAFGDMIRDRCKYAIVGPFIPDVAANKASPDNYMAQLIPMMGGLLKDNPTVTIYILSHYQTARADFTASNNGFGMRPERIDAFNDLFKQYCLPNRALGRIPQVVCVDTQKLFEGMGNDYILTGATRDEFKDIVYSNTGFRPTAEQFLEDNPNARLIGDGIHLSIPGRIRLMSRLAAMISLHEGI
jgi:hypothetical protein